MRIRRRQAHAVVVLGPDGSGKTTLVAALAEEAGSNAEAVYLGLGRGLWKKKWAEELYFRDHPTLKASTFCLFLKIFVLLVDLQSRVPWSGGGAKLVLVDRLPAGIMLKSGLLRFAVSHLIPPIGLVVLLTGDIKVFRRRKNYEDTELALIRETEVARELSVLLSPHHILEIDASSTTPECAKSRAFEALRKFLV